MSAYRFSIKHDQLAQGTGDYYFAYTVNVDWLGAIDAFDTFDDADQYVTLLTSNPSALPKWVINAQRASQLNPPAQSERR